MTQQRKQRILSGMRPTGKLHLGHLYGALINWVELQNKYESYHFVADWHALTTHYEDTRDLGENVEEMVMDWLAAGLDPKKATFFLQSRLPEHAELHLLFSMVTPLGWLERVPTYKEQLQNIRDRDLHTYGFLGYPVLQAADILMYKADFVPVGEDQVPHVELTREIARRFNIMYGELAMPNRTRDEWQEWIGASRLALMPPPGRNIADEMGRGFRQAPFLVKAELLNKGLGVVKSVFPEPGALLTPTPRLPGTDGRRMAKSYGNTILLSDTAEAVNQKVAGMMTDPARKRRSDPGNPDVCPVFDLHKIVSPKSVIDRVNRECRTAEIGCVECKQLMAGNLNQTLAPMRERRKAYEQNPKRVWEILDDGTERARRVAQETMKQVRAAVKIDYEAASWRHERPAATTRIPTGAKG